jgi:hypothetical protein
MTNDMGGGVFISCLIEQQIPRGNDKQKGKSKGNDKDRSRFPSGMTERKATAKATTKTEADSLQE